MRELLATDSACPYDGAAPFGAADSEPSGDPTVPRSRRLGQGGAEPSPLAPLPPSEVLEPGFQLGKAYRVERLIGFGGMGAVYEVEHLRLQKRFAAKVLRPEYSRDATALARFEREAVAASRIHHPNIVEVVNLDETPEGRVFIVEELLVGFDLTHLTRAGPLPLGLAVSVGITVARALQAAHAVGIVHRDLKPANIFLARRAGHVEVKVLDFGISKILGEAERAALTDTGGFVGTPLYMAPEQAKEGGVIDARTDVYALGVILYELLAGAPPFTSKNAVDLALKHVMEAPEPLATRNSAVPGALAEVVMGALAKAPADRPADMGAFADALTRAAERAALTLAPIPSHTHLALGAPGPSTGGLGAAVSTSAPQKRSNWATAAAFTVVLGLAAFGWAIRPRTPDLAPPTAPPITPVAAPPPPAPPARVNLELSSDPSGAEIEGDGQRLGVTPWTWNVEPSATPARLIFRHPGFAATERVVARDRPSRTLVKLAPLPKAKPSPTRPTPGPIDLPESR
jgi:serine/threonine protein kinase